MRSNPPELANYFRERSKLIEDIRLGIMSAQHIRVWEAHWKRVRAGRIARRKLEELYQKACEEARQNNQRPPKPPDMTFGRMGRGGKLPEVTSDVG